MNQDIIIKPWMLQDLHLQGAALLVFALWYADRQERTVRELAAMLGVSERGIRKVMSRVNEAKEQSSVDMEQSSENAEQSSQNKEQSSEIEKEKFPQTPIKEKIPLTPENAPAHPREDFIFWITDDASLRPYAEDFLNGLKARGVDPAQKGAADLRDHFQHWLPKYQAKREIMQRQIENGQWKMDHSVADRPERSVGKNGRMAELNLAKRDREAQAAALLREIENQESAAGSAEARSAMEAFFAKHASPGMQRNG